MLASNPTRRVQFRALIACQRILARRFAARSRRRIVDANPTSEHDLYFLLFISNSGGW